MTDPFDTAPPIPRRTSADVRRSFIDFFREKGEHTFWPSSPVVPVDDPTLLFTNAGMNQFKPLFLGQADPGTDFGKLRAAANSQKCIRAGGKHNDLDDVGKDTYHHTFFEMLGNWSFGGYFKREAIDWAWELLTGVYQIPADRLYATYFQGDPAAGLEPDDEAKEHWLRHLPPGRVLPGDAKDNFWEMGETGPCGPCSEIHYDRVGGRNAAAYVNTDDANVIEVWNLVFIQFDRQQDGSLKNLPAKHVDTGMGLERLTSILQNVRSNYDTDLFTPIFAAIERSTGAREYRGKLGAADADGVDTAYRVVADHARTLTFAITDGATPSNEGRGYVLRRILRRAVRYGRQMLGAKTGFLADLVPVIVDHMGEAFPELRARPERVREIILEEEESFGRTLDKGLDLFLGIAGTVFNKRAIERRETTGLDRPHPDILWIDGQVLLQWFNKKGELAWEKPIQHCSQAEIQGALGTGLVVSGEDAFKLYDTYGFPLDLTQLMAEERGLSVDVAGYEKCMAEQKERSRQGGKTRASEGLALDADAIVRLRGMNIPGTDDSPKHTSELIRATVRAIWNGHSFDQHAGGMSHALKPVGVVLDKTCCYAEAGGQVADHATITDTTDHRDSKPGTTFRVEDVRAFGEYILHTGTVQGGELRVGDGVLVKLDTRRRNPTMANHTATHMLNLGLRAVLGEGVEQKGSLVEPERLRFDFSHNKPVTPDEAKQVEQIVARQIEQDLTVYTAMAPLAEARQINGVRAVFGEAYPDPVRVVCVGQPVEDLLASPANPAWRELSVEFCGGTHLGSAGEAQHFALVHETGIAKGIRRVEALTGTAAEAAHATADQLAARIAAAGKLDAAALSEELPVVSGEIDQLTMPIWRKEELREAAAGLVEKLKAAQKGAAKELRARAVELARRIAESAKASLDHVVVTSIDEVAGDREALTAAAQTIHDNHPGSAVMLFNVHEGKVVMLASVPDELVKRGLKAGDWIRETAPIVGGKGGGRPNQAQGAGSDPAKLREAVKHARSYATKTLMG